VQGADNMLRKVIANVTNSTFKKLFFIYLTRTFLSPLSSLASLSEIQRHPYLLSLDSYHTTMPEPHIAQDI